MFNRRLFFLSIILFLLCQFVSIPFALARDDWQYWNEFQLKFALKEKLNLRFKAEQRLRDDVTDLYLTNYEAGIIFKANKYFEFGPLYLFEREKSLSGQVTNEHRLSFEGTLKWQINDIKLSNRHLFSHRDISGRESWTYRNKLKITYPVEINSLSIVPFIADEIFYDTVPDKFNQNRFSIGFSRQLTKHLEFEIYYLLNSKRARQGNWDEVNVVGTAFSITF